MRRRTVLASGLAALTAISVPGRRLSAADTADVAAIGLDGKGVSLKGGEIADLRRGLRGDVLTADQPGWDTARRLWNPVFDKKPALIVRCLGAADVRRTVQFAAGHALLTAVRGGGHSLSGQSACDGGIMIDLSPMTSVEVDPISRTARVEAGARLGQLDRESLAFNLATPVGTAADTGVAGLTLGGGVGRIGRRFGLTCDNLIGAEMVTADGKWVRATSSENPDLLWALRGGGGNFGVVTTFHYRLHDVNPIMYGGDITFPFEGARARLRSLADILATAPDDLYTDIDLGTDQKGVRYLNLNVCYCGPAGEAERVVAPLRKLGKADSDELASTPYAKLQGSYNAGGVSPLGFYGKGGLVSGLTPALIDSFVGAFESAPSAGIWIWMQHQGGAIARVPPHATAYFNRGASHNLGFANIWKMPAEDAERNTEWVRKAWAQVEPMTRGQYVNLAATDDRDARVHAAYGDNYPRLAALKKQFDPSNLFRLNANIKPA